jgi:phosphate transport system substrate-binding protein
MKRKVGIALAVAVLTMTLLVPADAQMQDGKVIIRVRGSDSMAGRVDALSKVYMQDHAKVNIVVSGGPRDLGVESLADESAQVAMAARRLTETEKQSARGKGVDLVERLVGHGGIVIVTHADNPVTELTMDQLRKIFIGDISRWSQVGGPDKPIKVFNVGDTHGSSVQFMESEILKGPFTSSAEIVSYFPILLRKVAQTPDSIGYTRVREVESPLAGEISLNMLKLKKDESSPAVSPSRAAIADGTYPLLRPFFLYLDNRASREVKDYAEFIVQKGWGKQIK